MAKVFLIGFATLFTILYGAHNSFACSVCYGAGLNAASKAAWALKISVISLLAILLCVIGSITWFFVQIAHRSRNICLTK